MSDDRKIIGSSYLPNCLNIRWDDVILAYWCNNTGNKVSGVGGYTGICDNCVHNKETIKTLKHRVALIRQIDEVLTRLHDQLYSLYHDGLSTEEINKLWDMVHADHKSHWT